MKLNNKFLKAILSIALCACMLVGFLPVSALAASSGSCGDGVNFSISGDTLTITGNGGIMDDAAFYCWDDQEINITYIGKKDNKEIIKG